MARPRAEIPTAERKELVRARDAAVRAETRLRAAVVAALAAGGSFSAVAETARIARSTVQEWAKD